MFFSTHREIEKEREKERRRGERKKVDRISVAVFTVVYDVEERWVDGRKKERNRSVVHTVINSCTMDGPILFPPLSPLSFQLYGVPLQKKRVRLPQRALSLSLSSCFLLRVVYRYYTRMQNVFRLLLTQVLAFESNSLGNEENLVCAFSPFPFSFVISSILYRNETRTGEIM